MNLTPVHQPKLPEPFLEEFPEPPGSTTWHPTKRWEKYRFESLEFWDTSMGPWSYHLIWLVVSVFPSEQVLLEKCTFQQANEDAKSYGAVFLR